MPFGRGLGFILFYFSPCLSLPPLPANGGFGSETEALTCRQIVRNQRIRRFMGNRSKTRAQIVTQTAPHVYDRNPLPAPQLFCSELIRQSPALFPACS